MPIVRINAESILSLSMQQFGQAGIEDYAILLQEQHAQLSVLEPGFNEDVTPACFKGNPAIPPIEHMFKVDKSGEKGVLTRRMAPGTNAIMHSVARQAQRERTTLEVEFGQQPPLRMPEDGAAFVIAHTQLEPPPPTVYVGGLILQTTQRGVDFLRQEFAR